MNPFEMVVVIVAISVGASVLKSYFKRRNISESEDFMDNLGASVDAHVKRKMTSCDEIL